ncbi:MAG TPA: hypothetical protein VGF73_08425 [Chthoniobacterales bacterium]
MQSLLLLLALIVVVALLARFGSGWYLGSEHFRRQITSAVDRELMAKGRFTPFRFTGGTFYSDSFAAEGKRRAFFSELRADQIRAVVNWRGLLGRRWEVDELSIQNLEVRFAGRTPEGKTKPAQPRSSPKKKKPTSWKLDLRKAVVAQSSWHWGISEATSGSLTKSGFVLTPAEGGWLIDASSGLLAQTGWPLLAVESARLRYTGGSLFVTKSTFRAGDGRIDLAGEVNFRRAADFEARLDQIDLTPLLTSDWRMRLQGKLAGSAKIHAPLPQGTMTVTGDLNLLDGQLEALPILNQIATFTRTERFRHITLTRGSLSFTKNGDSVSVQNLILESEGLLRVEGNCTIAHQKIDGIFQLGVTAASLQWLPGSQARVFTVARAGYYWTPAHVTGSIDHPHEDLTKRLVAAAAGELLQNPEKTLQDAAKSLLDLIPH